MGGELEQCSVAFFAAVSRLTQGFHDALRRGDEPAHAIQHSQIFAVESAVIVVRDRPDGTDGLAGNAHRNRETLIDERGRAF